MANNHNRSASQPPNGSNPNLGPTTSSAANPTGPESPNLRELRDQMNSMNQRWTQMFEELTIVVRELSAHQTQQPRAPRAERVRVVPQPPHRDERRDDFFDQPNERNHYDRRDRWDRGIKVELEDFEGRLHPDAFLDWIDRVDQYFEWKEIPEDKKVKFVSLKLKGHA